MQQVYLGRAPLGYLAVNRTQATPDNVWATEHATRESIILEKCPLDLCTGGTFHSYGYPRLILMYNRHHNQLVLCHESIVIAVVDIVKGWVADQDARFPERMPLLKDEEKLLQWLDTQVKLGTLVPYSAAALVSWRPDILVEAVNGDKIFQLTEINARFFSNGSMHGSYGQTALDDMGMERSGLGDAADGEELHLPCKLYQGLLY